MKSDISPFGVKLYTIGHGRRDLEEFLDLLDETGVNTIVDVRSYPHSNANPQFSENKLRIAVEDSGRAYHWAGKQLGGKRKGNVDSCNLALEDDDMRAFADYMKTESFQVAAMQLIKLASRSELAIMCAETLPEHCHRSLIADYLVLKGVQVRHILSDVEIRDHMLSEFARRESLELIYDRVPEGARHTPGRQ